MIRNSPNFIDDMKKIYRIVKQNRDYWNPFLDFLRLTMIPIDSQTLQLSIRTQTAIAKLNASTVIKKLSVSRKRLLQLSG